MRVISLLPAATEIVAALGALGRLVGVTHECDYPPEVRALPRVTHSRLDPGLSSGEIDGALVAGAQRPGARSRGRRAVRLRRGAGAPRAGPDHGPRRAGAARPARRVSRRQRVYFPPGAPAGRRRRNSRAVDPALTAARRF